MFKWKSAPRLRLRERSARDAAAAFAGLAAFLAAGSATALPSLQLGPGSGSWTYDVSTETWLTHDNPLNLLTFANATKTDGGHGGYAWSKTGTSQLAYLVVAAVPKNSGTEPPSLFDITVENDGAALPLYSRGNGAPPLSDPNDIGKHGIYDTYFELYEFNFDGPIVDVFDTVTGTDSGKGYKEVFDITIHSLAGGVESLHFDLFTIRGSGHLGSTDRVQENAPFTHDAQTAPEPGTASLLGLGLVGLAALGRRR